MRVRTRAPSWVKHLGRVARHTVSHWQPPPALPMELIAQCRMCASRDQLVEHLPKLGRIAELGTARGDFARHILAVCDPAKLHLIDIDLSMVDAQVAADPRVVATRGYSHDVIASFPDGHFDWIYVDADHSYAGVSRDIAAAAPKVKPGGFLVFNDFAHVDPWLGQYGVHRAVIEFAVSARWPLVLFAYNPLGLYDVALQKPSTG
jgi:SAM-dependent methyltransferase